MKKALIIAAHPDDDILGCGGIMSRFKNTVQFKVIFIAEGTSCRHLYNESFDEETLSKIEKRNKCGIKALEKLGVQEYTFYNLTCGRLDQIPIIEINKIIEKEIQSFKPDTIFTHSLNDTNNDHVIVYKSTLIATRPTSKALVKSIFSYEVLSSSEWKYTHSFNPNYFIQISENDIQNKWDALKEYHTEIKKFPYPRSKEGVITLAKYRGLQCQSEYAESFNLIRQFIK